MHKVTILKDFSIAFDGVKITKLEKGQEIEVNNAQLERLVHYGVVELKVKKVIEPTEQKIVDVTEKKRKNNK
jgi:hypothetical protein